jgi:exodeoxyribonuclease VII small subunit
MTYEERIRRLEEVMGELEGEGVPLDRALALFEEGIELLRGATNDLAHADERVQLLIERAEGAFETRDLDG